MNDLIQLKVQNLFILNSKDFFHKSFFNYYKSFLKPKLKINFSRYYSHECGMDATRFPSRQGCRVWGTKGFCLLLTFQK